MQWGKEQEYPDRLSKVYFPIPFPHKVFNINITGRNDVLTSPDIDNYSPIVGNDTTNIYFTVNTDGFPYMDRADVFYWIAIGY